MQNYEVEAEDGASGAGLPADPLVTNEGCVTAVLTGLPPASYTSRRSL